MQKSSQAHTAKLLSELGPLYTDDLHETDKRRRTFSRESERCCQYSTYAAGNSVPNLPPTSFALPTWKTVSLQWASHRRKVKILKLTEVNLLCYLNYTKSQHPFTLTYCLMCYYFPLGLIIHQRRAR